MLKEPKDSNFSDSTTTTFTVTGTTKITFIGLNFPFKHH
ncbi:hypothetical protein CF65_00619 [Aggregatibacter actinomycetemcomitans HK1651]|nr:hypothetical protein ANH9381_0586 [Aggregatibacter actinomycetemcomitans ANH9381]AHN71163.1 hypothetical protein CF65_00619 [Aggregatibacter actinomycetemcomitans HK1651]